MVILNPRPEGRVWPRLVMLVAGLLLSLSLAPAAEPEVASASGGSAKPPPPFRQADKIAVLTVRGEIDGVTLRSLERRMKAAVKNGAEAVVLDIDTFGGQVPATLDICNLLKDPSITPPNTVAWIHPKAYSAGTIIALACREIVVSPNATFGDAAPIRADPLRGIDQLAPAERAKIEGPLLEEAKDSARRNHYDENAVQAFVSVGIELWLIENKQTGERIFVDRAEYERVFGEEPREEITPITPSSASHVTPMFDEQLARLIRDQMKETERWQDLPPSRDPLTEADRDQWRFVTQVVSDDRLLTLKSAEALYYGIAQATISNDQELKAYFGAQELVRYDRLWSETLVRSLVSWPVRIVLIIVMLVCGFIELAAPGFGFFGAASLLALLVLIGAPYLAGLAQWWDLLMIVAGILLIAVEILVIPGFGFAGILGAVSLLVGLVGTFISGDLSSPVGQRELLTGIGSTLTAIFAAGVGIWLISRQIHTFPVLARLTLNAEIGERGRGARNENVGLLQAMGKPQRAFEIGDEGIAATDLRPAGRGDFAGRMVDVQSPGRYIERGRPIRVISVGRYVIEVEEVES
jgi:membrane-bound serine protease (ClpP class)